MELFSQNIDTTIMALELVRREHGDALIVFGDYAEQLTVCDMDGNDVATVHTNCREPSVELLSRPKTS